MVLNRQPDLMSCSVLGDWLGEIIIEFHLQQ
jgi:hypothetical protein